MARFAITAAIVALAGIPLIITPGLLTQYETTPKLALLLISTAALLFSGKAWWPGAVALLRTRHGRVFSGLLAVQTASVALSTALSLHPALSFAGSSWRRFGFVTQFAAALFCWLCAALIAAHPRYLRSLVRAVVCASGAIAAYSVLQYFRLDPLLDPKLYTTEYFGAMLRVPGTLGSAVYLGSFLAASIPLALGLASGSTLAAKWSWRAIALLSFTGVILCGARSALLALLAAAVVSMPLLRRNGRQAAWMAAAACGVLGAGLSLLAVTDAGASLRLRARQWRQDATGGPRLGVWRESLTMVAERPLPGYGPESFGPEFRRRQSAQLSRAYPEHFQESPHNFLLDGVIAGGVVFLAFTAGIVWLVFADVRQPVWLRASVVATAVSLLFVTVTVAGMVMFYGMLALLIAARTPVKAAPSSAPRVIQVPAALLSVMLVFFAIAYVRKDACYQLLANAAAAGRLDLMAAAYRDSTAGWLPSAGDDLWCSRQFAAVSAWSLAAEAAARAEATADNPADSAYQSALIAVSTNRAAQAELDLRRAIALAPTWYKPHLLLAQILHYTGRPADAQAEARFALDTAGGSQASAAQTLRSLGLL